MKNKLRRSKSNRMIAGVCGGMGEYLNVKPRFIRLLWIIFMFMYDTPALIAYIVCIFIIPEETNIVNSQDDVEFEETTVSNTDNNSSLYIGLGLIILGAYLLVTKFWPAFAFKFVQLKQYWPILLILIGIYILINRFKNND